MIYLLIMALFGAIFLFGLIIWLFGVVPPMQYTREDPFRRQRQGWVPHWKQLPLGPWECRLQGIQSVIGLGGTPGEAYRDVLNKADWRWESNKRQ